MRYAIVAAILLLGIESANASGGLSCRADDKNISIDVGTAMTRGVGGDFLNFKADLKLKMKAAPAELRGITLDGTDVKQRWLDSRVLKLHLYREKQEDPRNSIELVIETRAIDEGSYTGRYRLNLTHAIAERPNEPATLAARGKVRCSAE